jgi:hypothetical protein
LQSLPDMVRQVLGNSGLMRTQATFRAVPPPEKG